VGESFFRLQSSNPYPPRPSQQGLGRSLFLEPHPRGGAKLSGEGAGDARADAGSG